jgi:hypothetical protein
MEAARYGWWAQYLHSTGELRTDWYETYFAAPLSSTVAFDLYTFSNGVQVGEGSAGPMGATIPEPATVTLLACGAGAVLLGRVRRRIRDK